MKKKLIALYPILYEAKQYKIGDELPTNNNSITEKWISAETAVWKDEEKSSDFRKEDYEKDISDLKEAHAKEITELEEVHVKEIEKITAEKEEVENKLSELLKSQALGEIREGKENIDEKVNEDVQKTEEESSKSKTNTRPIKNKS